MTVTISRLYNNYDDARAAVRDLEAAGVGHNDISILASNADNWYSDDRKASTYPDRDLDGKDEAERSMTACRRTASASATRALTTAPPQTKEENTMGGGLLLWLIGIPIPIILLIWLFGGLH